MARILIIEDDDMLRQLLVLVLNKAGHEVSEAGNGREGLERTRSDSPEIIVTDLVMPELEGLETIMALRRDYPSIPIIATSGVSMNAASKLGARRSLSKPFHMEALLNAVNEVLAECGAPSGEKAEHRPPAFLVLDDDADSRFLNRRQLRKAFPDCSVIECATANEAVRHCTGQKVDAILADHHLRGMDGVTFVWRLRHQRVICPILMVTADSNEAVRQQAYNAGVTEIFSDENSDFIPYLKGLFQIQTSLGDRAT